MPSPSREEATEAEIGARGSTHPRLTPDDIDRVIVGEGYHRFPGTSLTVCALTLANGYVVVGISASAAAENFDEGLGRRIARDKAREQIWPLEGYLLRQRLSEEGNA
jgi:hypothetical protein